MLEARGGGLSPTMLDRRGMEERMSLSAGEEMVGGEIEIEVGVVGWVVVRGVVRRRRARIVW